MQYGILKLEKRKGNGNMSRIYSKAKDEIEQKAVTDPLEYLEALKDDENWHEKIMEHINEMISESKAREAKKHEGVAWDFSAEKTRENLISDLSKDADVSLSTRIPSWKIWECLWENFTRRLPVKDIKQQEVTL